jgi:hypothetical protein
MALAPQMQQYAATGPAVDGDLGSILHRDIPWET